VFTGSGQVSLHENTWAVEHGDLFVVPSWQPCSIATDTGIDLFRFADTPIFERLHQDRVAVDSAPEATR
jgi:gentisate 1,2-dioxygenase